MREILHFQLGNKSNYVGTHLWNTLSQHFENGNQSFDEDVLYRKGEFKEVLNYTPRLISVDLKGSKKMGAGLYGEEDVENQQPVYNTPPLKINRSNYVKNEYQKDLDRIEENELDWEETPKTYSEHLTETTKLWSDFNGCYYHPLTWNEIEAYTHNSTTAQFANFTQGTYEFEHQDFGLNLMEDKVRKFMEECDSPQGFQIIADADDAFSGFTYSLLQELRQEYSKKAVMIYSLSKSSSHQSVMGRVNQSLLLKSAEEEDCVFIPIKLPSQSDLNNNMWSKYLSPKFDTLYQQSGYVAAAIENVSLPFRLSDVNKRMDMYQLQQLLEYQSVTTCAMALGFPPLTQGMKVPEICELFGPQLNWARNLTVETDQVDFASAAKNFAVVSGISDCSRLVLNRELREGVQSRLDLIPGCNSQSFFQDSAFQLSKSFPQFFSKNVSSIGLVTSTHDGGYVEKVSVVTTLSSGAFIDQLYQTSWDQLRESTRYGATIPGFEKEEINEFAEYFASKL